jgi:hypothetical protein
MPRFYHSTVLNDRVLQTFLSTHFFFVIELKDGVHCGTIRVYDLKGDSFFWGSWILNENRSHFAALKNALLIYDFGFNELGFFKSHFYVTNGNNCVAPHYQMHAQVATKDANNYSFEISERNGSARKSKLMDRVL